MVIHLSDPSMVRGQQMLMLMQILSMVDMGTGDLDMLDIHTLMDIEEASTARDQLRLKLPVKFLPLTKDLLSPMVLSVVSMVLGLE